MPTKPQADQWPELVDRNQMPFDVREDGYPSELVRCHRSDSMPSRSSDLLNLYPMPDIDSTIPSLTPDRRYCRQRVVSPL